jgi:hypothetical protein
MTKILPPGTRVVVLHDGGAKVPALGTITRAQIIPTENYDVELDGSGTRLLSHPPSAVVALTTRQEQLVALLRASGNEADVSSRWVRVAAELVKLGVAELTDHYIRLTA